MEKKKFAFIGLIVCTLAVCSYGIYSHLSKKEVSQIKEEQVNKEVVSDKQSSENTPSVSDDKKASKLKNKQNVKQASIEKDVTSADNKIQLYNPPAGSVLPLSVLSVASALPQNIQDKITRIAENNNIFMLQQHNNKLLLITDNPNNIRHGVDFTEISLNNGHQIKTTLGYSDKMKDSENDIWEYDNVTKQPLRHTKYNKNGDIDFIETWNYTNDNPIKYEMKDAEGHVLSLRKETLDNGVNLRVDHLIYDKEGNTKINVSATYDGQDVKRFTYYNADKPSEGGAVYGDYSDGVKIKEIVYTPDLKLKNSYTAKYKDGECEEVIIWDSQNREINKLSTESTGESL